MHRRMKTRNEKFDSRAVTETLVAFRRCNACRMFLDDDKRVITTHDVWIVEYPIESTENKDRKNDRV